MITKKLSSISIILLFTTNTFSTETLQNINVTTATKSTQTLNSTTENISVITSEDIKERGYTTVTQALNSLSGISFTQNGGLGSPVSIYLRGMDSKRTLVLIDGVRFNDPTGLNGAPYEHLMISNIEQIEVIKGAQSGIWGSDASAGVINIITKKNTIGSHGSYYAELGSFTTKKYGLNLSKKTDKFYVNMGKYTTKTDGFSSQLPEGGNLDEHEDDGYKNITTLFDFGYQINATNKINLSHKIIDAKNEYDTFSNPNANAYSNTHDRFSSVNLNHIDSFNELNIYAKKSKFNRKYVAPNYEEKIETTSYKGEIKEYGATSKIPYSINNFVLLGAEYIVYKQYDSLKKSYNNKSFFLSNSNTLKGASGGETIIAESLRYDAYSSFKKKTTGKIGLKHFHEKIKGLVSSVNYGTAYNVPTPYQLYSPYGTDTLNPENTKSFDITVSYKDLTLTYFNTRIDDMIDFDLTTYKYANISGTSKISGIETSYQKDIFTHLMVSINYTHLFNLEDPKGDSLKRRIKDNVKITLDYYGITNLHLGLDSEYVGSRTDVKFKPDFTTVDVETGKYTLFNMTINYNIIKDMNLYARIENITDVSYQTAYGFTASPRAYYTGIKASF